MVAVKLDNGRASGPTFSAVPAVVALVGSRPHVGLGDVGVVGVLVGVLEQKKPDLNKHSLCIAKQFLWNL